jgi:hypothetical protein
VEKTKLHKALYNACRSRVHPSFRDDSGAVRALRDHECHESFGKPYDELSVTELTALIDRINTDKPNSEAPTKRQLDVFRFYAFAVALVYCNFDDWDYIDSATGEILSGEVLRRELTETFYDNTARFPTNVVRRVYEEWINPKSNEFLIQGGFRKEARKPNVMYYERLSQQELRYLISRYSLIYNEKINKSIVKHNISMN